MSRFIQLVSAPYSCFRSLRQYSILRSIDRPTKLSSITPLFSRRFTNSENFQKFQSKKAKQSTILYFMSAIVFMIGATYSSVPLYRRFCQTSQFGKYTNDLVEISEEKIASMKPIRDRPIRVNFTADVNSSIDWNFRPSQSHIHVVPGETALAFYTARNPSDEPVIGIATYSILPSDAGKYFNKIQCFCFEEQRLNPHEEVDMPVFFFLDPEMDDDPALMNVDTITLSYTFFKAKPNMSLPLPGYSSR